MGIPTIVQRDKRPSGLRLSVTILSKAISGEDNCPRRLWNQARRPSLPTDGPVSGLVRHAAELQRIAQSLPSGECRTEVRLATFDPAIVGRVDILQETSESVIVHEIKAGIPRPFHLVQVALYSWLVRVTGIAAGRPVEAILHYRGRNVILESEDLLEVERALRGYLRMLRAQEPAEVRGPECVRCSISACQFRGGFARKTTTGSEGNSSNHLLEVS